MLNRSVFFSPLNWILYTRVVVPVRNNPCSYFFFEVHKASDLHLYHYTGFHGNRWWCLLKKYYYVLEKVSRVVPLILLKAGARGPAQRELETLKKYN